MFAFVYSTCFFSRICCPHSFSKVGVSTCSAKDRATAILDTLYTTIEACNTKWSPKIERCTLILIQLLIFLIVDIIYWIQFIDSRILILGCNEIIDVRRIEPSPKWLSDSLLYLATLRKAPGSIFRWEGSCSDEGERCLWCRWWMNFSGRTPRNSLLNWDDLLNHCLCSPYPAYAATNTRPSWIAIFLHTRTEG